MPSLANKKYYTLEPYRQVHCCVRSKTFLAEVLKILKVIITEKIAFLCLYINFYGYT